MLGKRVDLPTSLFIEIDLSHSEEPAIVLEDGGDREAPDRVSIVLEVESDGTRVTLPVFLDRVKERAALELVREG